MALDPEWIESLEAYEAQAVLEKLAEHFAGGMSPREAVELHKMQRALQAKVERR